MDNEPFKNQKKCPKCLKMKQKNEFKPRPNGTISYCYPCEIEYYSNYNKKRYGTPEKLLQERQRTRLKYQNQRKPERQIRKKILIMMMGGKCSKCRYKRNVAALDFHHYDPENKLRTVSHLIASMKSFEDAYKEARKCFILCSNCHREETYPDWTMDKIVIDDWKKELDKRIPFPL